MRLKKDMYGTKQAARCWWLFFKQKMEDIGFIALELEQSLYIYRRDNEFVIIWLHADDGFAVASRQPLLDGLQTSMTAEMKMKWSKDIKQLVGITFTTQDGEITLDQSKLAHQIVNDYDRPVFTH